MTKRFISFFSLVAVALFLTGCGTVSVPQGNSSTYSTYNVNRAQHVEYGTVVSSRQVVIQGGSGIGTGAGALTGGIVGNKIGRGSGKSVATIAGVLLGGTVGKNLEQENSRQMAQEVTIRRQYDMISVIQGMDQQFYPGDRVMIHSNGNGDVRVTRY
jgi:outer membrane lipoprotein SlyB